MHYSRGASYPKHLHYLIACSRDITLFYLTSTNRRKVEHFIDSESRFANRTRRESEYALAKRLQDTGSLCPESTNNNGRWADTYYQMLWLYNICVVMEYAIELRRSLIPLAITDLETWKCQYHKTDC